MNQTQDLIGHAARLSVVRDAYVARGMAVPAHITASLQRIETLARARLSPAQLAAAMHHYEVARMQTQQEAYARQSEQIAARANAQVDQWFGKVTAGMLGQERLTRDQVQALARGKEVPLRSKRMTQEQRDAAFRERTRTLDPRGNGWTEAEYAKRMDALADATPGTFGALAKGYTVDPSQLRKAANRWKDDRIGYELQKRREAADRSKGLDNAPPVVTDRDRRRAALIEAYANASADEMERDVQHGRVGRASDSSRELNDELSLETLNETDNEGKLTRRAVMARALESQDSEDYSEE